jgi:6-pyruvoyltetrahydropterin/6-carboxytetrahydropterin synthase
VALQRTVRFCVNPSGAKHLRAPSALQDANSFAAAPAMRGLGAYYELVVGCVGQPDGATGYLLNISSIDRAVRSVAIPIIQDAFERHSGVEPARVLGDVLTALRQELGGIVDRVQWRMTPYYSLSMSVSDTQHVCMSQSFEFAAAHRLNVDGLDAAANRAIFGKCNNVNGHGHNYRIEVAVAVPLEASRFTLQTLEGIVVREVINRFDHKHLNLDTAEFGKVNPSVENIARTCHGLLARPVADAGGILRRVTVWETEKTSCSFPA